MIKKIFRYAKSLDEKIKFVLVGGLNTVIGYGISALVLLFFFDIPLNLKDKATALQTLISAACGHIAGTTNAYFWNKYFTFLSKEKSFSQVCKFILVSILQLTLNYSLVILFQDIIGMGIYPAQCLTLIITTIFSYLGHKNFSFKSPKVLTAKGE
jgi:putative flippase GtrA